MKNKKNIDFTQGNLYKAVLFFTIPMMIGNIFQQGYNFVDSYVVGNFLGKNALAAAGSCTSILHALTSFFSGISLALNIEISKMNGAGDNRKMKSAIETGIISSIVFGLFATAMALLFGSKILHLINVKDSIFADAHKYYSFYMLGTVFNLTYNMGASVLRGVGDSRNPIIALVISSISNIVLDLVFILGLKTGVEGTAIATAIAQGISAMYILSKIIRFPEAEINLLNMHMDFDALKRFVKLGLPVGIQNTLVMLSGTFGQSYVNLNSEGFIAGYSVANRIEMLVMTIMNAFQTATATVVSQNMGANKYERVRESLKVIIITSLALAYTIAAILFVIAPVAVSIFNKDPEVVKYGTICIRYVVFFMPLITISHTFNHAVRSAGNTTIPMLMTVANYTIVKTSYLYFGYKYIGTFYVVLQSIIISYLFADLISVLYFRFSKFTKDAKLRV